MSKKTETKLTAVPEPRKASRERFELAEHTRRVFNYFAPAGTTEAEVLQAGFWATVATKLTVWDRIEVAEEKGQWLIELVVLAPLNAGVVVHELHRHELPGVGVTNRLPSNTGGTRIEFKGAHLKWCVIAADGSVLKDRLPKETDARSYLESHNMTTGDAA